MEKRSFLILLIGKGKHFFAHFRRSRSKDAENDDHVLLEGVSALDHSQICDDHEIKGAKSDANQTTIWTTVLSILLNISLLVCIFVLYYNTFRLSKTMCTLQHSKYRACMYFPSDITQRNNYSLSCKLIDESKIELTKLLLLEEKRVGSSQQSRDGDFLIQQQENSNKWPTMGTIHYHFVIHANDTGGKKNQNRQDNRTHGMETRLTIKESGMYVIFSHMTFKTMGQSKDVTVTHRLKCERRTNQQTGQSNTLELMSGKTVLSKSQMSFGTSFLMDVMYLRVNDAVYTEVHNVSFIYRMYDANYWGVVKVL